jgi:ketosteroid isomerase-like protein
MAASRPVENALTAVAAGRTIPRLVNVNDGPPAGATNMRLRIIGLAVVCAAAQPMISAQSPAAGTADVTAVVRQFVDGFNKGDAKALASTCADQVAIIDEFPPHAWQGTGACGKWSSDYEADAKKNGISDGVVTLGKPTHVDVSGDRAYVVWPADYVYKMKGKLAGETGSILTVALHKDSTSWRITGWSWAKH